MVSTKRVLTFVFCLTLILTCFVYTPERTVEAAEKKTIVIAASDFQADTHELSQKNMLEIFEQIKKDYDHADGFLFCGDYGLSYDANDSSKGIMTLVDTIEKSDMGIDLDNLVLLQGNHDILGTQNLAPMGDNDPEHGQYGVFAIPEDSYMWFSGYDRHDGSPNIGDHIYTVNDMSFELYDYLEEKINEGYTKPIFVISHLPLHYSMRTYVYGDSNYADLIYECLEYGAKNGLNIIFMHGHNHSQGWDNYLGGARIFLDRGDTMPIAKMNTRFECNHVTLPFVDLNAGYIGYFKTGDNENVDKTLTMSVYEISDTEVIIRRYSKDGEVDLKARGVNNSKMFVVNYHAVSEPSLALYKVDARVYKSGHVMPLVTEYVAPKDPTCTTKGTLGYYYCKSNDTYYTDATLTEETTVKDREIDYSHKYDSGYKTTALEHFAKCKCGAVEEIGEKHSFNGLICKVCNYKLTLEKIPATKASCSKSGNNEYYYCAQNGKYYKDASATTPTSPEQEKIPALDHAYNSGYLKSESGHKLVCSCTAISEEYEHVFDDGTCTECGYTKEQTPAPTSTKKPKPTASASTKPTPQTSSVAVTPQSSSTLTPSSSIAASVTESASVAVTSSSPATTTAVAATSSAPSSTTEKEVISPTTVPQSTNTAGDNSAAVIIIGLVIAAAVAALVILLIKRSKKK